jgi:DNA (cytosine-5)-methyltransferase 1
MAMPRSYYSEWEPYCAEWLRNLIREGLIPDGDVDDRDIRDVRPEDLRGYTQCHFFAGFGGWAYALRLAGWADDREVWTGSCPCQPFSAAGKRKGTADERHLWPDFYRLISERSPSVVFGEQVASKDGRLWLAGVRSDLEDVGYAVGAADLCAAGVGSPQIRQRLWWVAHAYGGHAGAERQQRGGEQRQQPEDGSALRLAGADIERRARINALLRKSEAGRLAPDSSEAAWGREADGMGDPDEPGSQGWGERLVECPHQWPVGQANIAVLCTDGTARRIEPGSFPLAHGVPARVAKLRAFGNAIVPQVAAEFIRAADAAELLRHA